MPDTESQIYSETIARAKFFQTVHAWPLSEDLNYDGWLKNFNEGEERNIACNMLDFFIHYSSKMVEQMLKTSVSNSGYILAKHFVDWQHSDFKDRCIYSFIPGETLNPTDSGHIFTRILRDVMGIPENRIVNYIYLPQKLDSINKPTPIIFVDDFVGSGNQVRQAWLDNKFTYNNKTLSEICSDGNHCAIYAPLIVNCDGHTVITTSCKGLHLCATHILGPEYDMFNKDCICWKNDIDLFYKGTALILKKSGELGIPSTNGQHVNDEKGFGAQGLAISFHHGAPDAILPLFYWKENWTPLIKKQYQR
ncbi:MAG: hypothetical protein JWP44_1658 [Mucilaginibacter sp.]|nr:hypothetical protein [Mucilaginibacter sp.]